MRDYDVSRKDDFGWLFGKTEIGRNPTKLANSYLILRLNFSLIKVGDSGDLARIEMSFNEHVTNQTDSFHLPWGKGCVDNEIEHCEVFEFERRNPNLRRCLRCGYMGYLPTHKCGNYGAKYSE